MFFTLNKVTQKSFFIFLCFAIIGNVTFGQNCDFSIDYCIPSCKGVQTNTNSRSKHFTAAIFVDEDAEIDSEKGGVIRGNFEIFLYKQMCPLLVIGGHLLSNVFDIQSAVKRCSDNFDKELSGFFYRELEKEFLDFDKKWLVFKFNDSFNFLIIPRKYIEYFFNLDLNRIECSLLDTLQDLCRCGELIKSDKKPYKNLSEFFKSCGFDGYHEIFEPILYQDLIKIKIDKQVSTNLEFYVNANNVFKNVFCSANQSNKWYLYFDGHGSSDVRFKNNGICGFYADDFLKLFKRLCKKNVEWICLSSCFLGGKPRELLEETAAEFKEMKMCPNLAILSSADSPSYGMSLWGGASKYYLDFAKKYEQFLFETIKEGKYSKYPYSICCNKLLGTSFFRGESVIDALINSIVSSRDSSGGIKLSVSNWPLILNPKFEPKFLPLEDKRYSFRITSRKLKFDKVLKISGQKLVFLEVPFVSEIEIEKKVPFIISGGSGKAKHIINQVFIQFDANFKEVVKNLFVDEYFHVACCKEFFINQLCIKKSKYHGIYVKQYFDKKINKETEFYIIEFKWFDDQIKKFYCAEYRYDDKKDKNEDEKKDITNNKKEKNYEWVEVYNRTMTEQEAEAYELFLQKEEKKIIDELSLQAGYIA